MSLEVGKTIDVLKYDLNSKQQMWTRGDIVAVTGDISDISKKMLTIAYKLDCTLSETRYPADSAMIAPDGTKSIAQNWRDQL